MKPNKYPLSPKESIRLSADIIRSIVILQSEYECVLKKNANQAILDNLEIICEELNEIKSKNKGGS